MTDGAVDHARGAAALANAGFEVATAIADPELALIHVAAPTTLMVDFLVELRRTRERARLPAIVLCDGGDPEFAVACLDAGANDYCGPPPGPAELVARVRSQLLTRRTAEQWRRGSYVDPLTGLLNRRGLLHYVDQEIARAVRHGSALSVAFLDLDNFNEINNRRGHGAGDDVLRAIGHALQRLKRRCDVAARWGGDEFVIALPGSGRHTTLTVLARIDETIARLRGDDNLGASFGVACLFDDVPVTGDGTAARLIEAADVAMYCYKSGHGRRLEHRGAR